MKDQSKETPKSRKQTMFMFPASIYPTELSFIQLLSVEYYYLNTGWLLQT